MSQPVHPVELVAPDISAYRAGNTGIDHVWSFDSGVAGPHVAINAVMHGNEICGAIALDTLLKAQVRPLRGKLTLAFVNVAAYLTFDPAKPEASRFVEEDLNRVWTSQRLDGADQSPDLARARTLRPLYDTVDYLLDIHSMGTRSKPLVIAHGLDKERILARAMAYPPLVVCGSGHVEGARLIEYAPFNDPRSHKTALLVECGQHWHRDTATVALDTALHFLRALGVVDPAVIAAHLTARTIGPVQMLEVTHGITAQTDAFRWAQPFVGLEAIATAGTVIATDGDTPVTTPYDGCVLVMPHSRPKKGQRALRLARPVP